MCMVIALSFVMPVYAENKEIKTTPLKSFFTRFVKKKTEVKSQSPEEKTVENSVSTLKGGIVFSLEDCVEIALKNDPTLKIYTETQKAQKNAVGIAKSAYFPRLIGGTGYYVNNTKYTGDRSDSLNNNYYGLDLGINQLIWDFGYTNAKINMNKYNYEAAGYDLSFQRATSIYAVRFAYNTVLASRANEDIYERAVNLNEINVARTKAMYQVGLKSKIDLVNAQATLTQAKIDLLSAQNAYQNALISLNNSMFYVDAPDYSIKETETFNFQKNYTIKNEIDIAYNRKNYNPDSVDNNVKDGAVLTSQIEKTNILKTYKFKPLELTLQEALKSGHEKRPDLNSLRLVAKASEESLKAIKRSYLPAIDASANYSMMKRNDYGYNAVGLYAGMDLPTVNAMAIKNQIAQGKSYLEIAKNNVDLLDKNIYFSIQSYYINMKQLEKQIPLMSQKVEQSLENFELADGRYAVGLGNYIELQQAQTAYNQSQLAFVQSVFNYNQAIFYLKRAMGIL